MKTPSKNLTQTTVRVVRLKNEPTPFFVTNDDGSLLLTHADGTIPTASDLNSLRDAIDSSLQRDRDAYNRALKDGQ